MYGRLQEVGTWFKDDCSRDSLEYTFLGYGRRMFPLVCCGTQSGGPYPLLKCLGFLIRSTFKPKRVPFLFLGYSWV